MTSTIVAIVGYSFAAVSGAASWFLIRGAQVLKASSDAAKRVAEAADPGEDELEFYEHEWWATPDVVLRAEAIVRETYEEIQ